MRRFSKYITLASLLFATLILGAGLWLENSVTRELEQGLAVDLKTIRDSNVAALKQWMQAQERIASLSVAEPDVREAALALIEASRDKHLSPEQLFDDPLQERLRALVAPTITHWEFEEYVLVAGEVIVGASDPAAMGHRIRAEKRGVLEKLEAEGSLLSRPQVQEERDDGTEQAAMWVASPIRDALNRMQGALAFRIDPQKSFTTILQTAQYGSSGESYAFDAQGLMLSSSRFDSMLQRSGVLEEGQQSLLTLEVRDPGLNLSRAGAQALKKKGPLTLAVRSAAKGSTGVNIHGYRDYRGVQVVGAWTWLPEYEFGVATEIDKAEVYQSVVAVQKATRALVLVLLLAALLIFGASLIIARLHRKAQKAERLGQYTIERKLGEGGMGAVYKARHALLRRPTAIKMIRPESIDERTRERFEREVQATANLCHPNTIAIYDYGRTQAGVFYYAMEFLGGVDLHKLVEKNGPLPERRVVYILLQVLASLAEAHELGMVHRDIKPPNIMLCRRGGVADLVKVLDFGLVKDIKSDDGFTIENALTGTPHYMAPETVTAADHVDQRTDLYAVAAVAFFLLTGRQLFNGPTAMAILTKQIADPPPRPSEFAPNPVSNALETLIMKCLEKEQDKRPGTARELLSRLEKIQSDGEIWSQTEAHAWWDSHNEAFTPGSKIELSAAPTVEVDMSSRARKLQS